MIKAEASQDFRAELRQAQRDLRDATTALAGASRALERAQLSVTIATREVAELSSVESEAQAFVAEAQAQALAEGGDVVDEVKLPTDLAQRRIRYTSAQRRLGGLKSALGQLERQHADAEHAVAGFKISLTVQALGLLAGWGEIRAKRLSLVMREARTLYHEMSAVSGVNAVLGQRPMRIPWSPEFKRALDYGYQMNSHLGLHADRDLPALRPVADFGALLRALEEDADTVLPE